MKSRLRNKGKKVTLIGLFINFALFTLKILIGFLGRSSALIADGFHSLSDIFTDIITLIGLRASLKEVDETHPYGHEKAESISAYTLGIFLIFASIFIIYNSVVKIINVMKESILLTPTYLALSVAFFSILIKELLYQYTISIGKKLNSSAIIANAWHHRSDALSSIAVFSGIGFAILLGNKWILFDPLAGLFVSFFILKAGIDILKKEIEYLMEASPEKDVQKNVESIIKNNPNVEGVHKLRMRYIGNKLALDFHLGVDEELSVIEAHNIATSIESQIKKSFKNIHSIVIHVEPFQCSSRKNVEKSIMHIVEKFQDILGYHGLQIFHVKEGFVVALDIVLPHDFSLEKAHEIAEELKRKILSVQRIKDVVIHLDSDKKDNS